MRPLPDQTDPTSPYYWRREELAYTSGVLNRLAAALVAARRLGTTEYRCTTPAARSPK